MKKIITISREFGSGGRTVGKLVAEKMGYKYYDKEIIEQVAEETGFSKAYISRRGEHSPSASMFSYSFMGRSHDGLSTDDYLFSVQRKIILKLAEEGNCVIVGRCADDITFSAMVCNWDRAKVRAMAKDQWVTVKAKIDVKFHPSYRGKGPVLTALEVRLAKKPEPEVATFY